MSRAYTRSRHAAAVAWPAALSLAGAYARFGFTRTAGRRVHRVLD